MKCPKCGADNSQIISKVTTSGKYYSASKGCCGYILAGPIGLLCGACGEERKTNTSHYWICNDCGNKWKA